MTRRAFPPKGGALRSALRARRVRHRVPGGHEEARLPRVRGNGHPDAPQPESPGSVRLRGEHGRRSGNSAADAPPFLRGGLCRFGSPAARPGNLWRRHDLPPRSDRGAPRVRANPGRRGPGGGPGRAVLADGSGRQFSAGTDGEGLPTGDSPDLHRRSGDGAGTGTWNGSSTSFAGAPRTGFEPRTSSGRRCSTWPASLPGRWCTRECSGPTR